jgi:hypothetical protein
MNLKLIPIYEKIKEREFPEYISKKGFTCLRNDRLQRVQVGRELDVPLDSHKGLWFLVIYKSGEWDSENSLGVFLDDLKKDLIENIFCVWNGQYRTNLFLLTKDFILKKYA